MLLSSTQGISKSIVRVFFFFETILFNLQKKKEKWRETKYSMKVTKRKMYMYIIMSLDKIKSSVESFEILCNFERLIKRKNGSENFGNFGIERKMNEDFTLILVTVK